jgi:hypothetical protein
MHEKWFLPKLNGLKSRELKNFESCEPCRNYLPSNHLTANPALFKKKKELDWLVDPKGPPGFRFFFISSVFRPFILSEKH